MTKIFVPFPKEEFIDFYMEQNIDGFFLGIDKFSMNFNRYIKIEELSIVIKKIKDKNIKSYICLNKLYYEDDINDLKELLFKIEKLDVDAVLFSDVSIYNIVKENNLNINLVNNMTHILTNYKTVNFWNKRGVKVSILSTEITIGEIKEIKNQTNSSLGITLYGFLSMMTSSRELITNYFKHINKKTKSNKYNMTLSLEKYPIVEENNITNIFTSKVLNGIKYFPSLINSNIDFVFLDDYMLENNYFYNVIEAFNALKNAPDDKEFIKKLEEVVDLNTNYKTATYFLNRKTIFKVKDNEKN